MFNGKSNVQQKNESKKHEKDDELQAFVETYKNYREVKTKYYNFKNEKSDLKKRLVKMDTTTGKQSQKEFVKVELLKHGFITRNKCLRNYISRLSDIIFRLKDEGFEFETKFVENKTAYGTEKDFIYIWSNRKEGNIETTYFFKWFDGDGVEYTVEIKAKSFDEACSIFLTQSPIFLEEIFSEVHTKVGVIFSISDKEEFKQFKIKK